MSSSDDDFEDDSLCKFGTQLPQFEAGKKHLRFALENQNK
jgi:hypothetical protein